MHSNAPETTNAWPVLKGLVLAGGRSKRMGHDKARMHWHGREQQYYMADLLLLFCASVYISCRPEQAEEILPPYQTLSDAFPQPGPMSALLTAFEFSPHSAWLVVACDMPLLDEEHIKQLITHRNPSAAATAFQSPRDGSPEPLAAIWEPKSGAQLRHFTTQNITCPRKALLNSDTQLVIPFNPLALSNINTPEEEALLRSRLI